MTRASMPAALRSVTASTGVPSDSLPAGARTASAAKAGPAVASASKAAARSIAFIPTSSFRSFVASSGQLEQSAGVIAKLERDFAIGVAGLAGPEIQRPRLARRVDRLELLRDHLR